MNKPDFQEYIVLFFYDLFIFSEFQQIYPNSDIKSGKAE